MRFAILAACCLGLSLAAPGYAHHSTTMFDANKVITLHGTVREFQYANPHAWLIVVVLNPDGTTTTWGFEGPAGPTVMMRAGIHHGDLPPGTKVIVKGHPMKDGRNAGQWMSVTRESDGKVFSLERVL